MPNLNQVIMTETLYTGFTKTNAAIDFLNKLQSSNSAEGASLVGLFPIPGLAGSNVQLALQNLKGYIDNVLLGLLPKDPAKAATTANITLSGAQTIDDVSVVAGDRVLVKDQTNATQNGIYVVATGAWTRATDADNNITGIGELRTGTYIHILQGTVNATSAWVMTTTGTITLGTSNLTFTLFNGASQLVANGGLTRTGNVISVATGGITDTLLGNRTVNPAIASAYTNTDSLTNILSYFAKVIGQIKGSGDWTSALTKSMSQLDTSITGLSTSKLDTTATAADAAKLGGALPAAYASRQTNTTTVASAGWYRIASNGNPDAKTGGDRAIAHFSVSEGLSSYYSFINFVASFSFGMNPTLNLVNRSSYGATVGAITKIRLVSGGTYEGASIDVYVSQPNTPVSCIMYHNDLASGWTPVNFTLIGAASNTTITTLNLDTINSVFGTSTNGLADQTYIDRTGNIAGNRFFSTVPTGTSPLTVVSTTKVSNLNADFLDGYDAGNGSGNIPISNGTVNTNLNADLHEGYHAGNATGNIPVSNGTVNTNLNADMLDSLHSTSFGQLALANAWTNTNSFTQQITSSLATGTAPLAVTSTTVNTNFNADMLDGVHSTGFVKVDGTQAMTGNLVLPSYSLSAAGHSDHRYVGNRVFAAATANQKVDIVFPAVNSSGWLEVELVGGWSTGDSSGKIVKRMSYVVTAPSTINSVSSQYVAITGPIGSNISIGDLRWTGTNFVVTIANLITANGNTFNIFLRGGSSATTTFITGATLGAVYTTDSTAYPAPIMDLPNGVTSNASKIWTQGNDGSGSGLDADLLDGLNSGNASGNIPVSNGTVNTNLNADKLDGFDATAFGQLSTTNAWTAVNSFSQQITSSVATGTAPLVVASTTKVTNLNADLLDGYDSSMSATLNTVAVRDSNADLYARVFSSNVATGNAPLTVVSTTKVTNLNADYVDGYQAGPNTAGTLLVLDASGLVPSANLPSAGSLSTSGINVINTTGAGNIVDFKVNSVLKASVDTNGKFTGTLDWANLIGEPTSTVANIDDAVTKRHTQNTDTGTTSQVFQLQSGSSGVKIKNNAGVLEARNAADSAYADLVVNNLTVKGTTTTIDSNTLVIGDNMITLNNDYSGSAPTENAGVEVNRGSLTKANIIWDETNDLWKAGLAGAEQTLVLTNDARLHAPNTDNTLTGSGINVINTTGAGNIVDFKVNSTVKASITTAGKFTGTIDWSGVTTRATDLSGYGITDAVKIATLASSSDLNTATVSGIYRIGATMVNAPTGVTHGQLLVMHGGGDTITQIVSDYGSTYAYWRSGNPSDVGGVGVWGPWRKFWHDGNFDPATKADTHTHPYLSNDTSSEQTVSGGEVRVQSTTTTERFSIQFNATEGCLDFIYNPS